MRHLLVAVTAAAALGAAPVVAQTAAHQFNVGAHAGWTKFASSTALENSPFVGVDGTYRLPVLGKSTDVGIGFTFAASRPRTDGTQFPVVAFDFGDTTFLYTVAQRVTMLQYGLEGQIGQHMGPARLYAVGAGGMYTIMPDARQTTSRGRLNFTSGMGSVGGGIEYAFGGAIGVRAEARDFVMFGFKRDRLDPTVSYIRDQRILDVLPPPGASKSTVHNVQAAIVFSYIPNRRGAPEQGPGGVER